MSEWKREIDSLRRELEDLKRNIRIERPRPVNNLGYLIVMHFAQGQGGVNASARPVGAQFSPYELQGTPCFRLPGTIEYRKVDPAPDPLITVLSMIPLDLNKDDDGDGLDLEFYGLCMADMTGKMWLISPPWKEKQDVVRSLVPLEESDPNYPGFKRMWATVSYPFHKRRNTDYIEGEDCSQP